MSDIGDSDVALWSRSMQGDGAAFGVLYDQHRDRVFRHALRLVQSRADAEDVAAVAFFELWRRRLDVRLVNESVLPWLLVTTTNVARNVRRSTARYRRLLDSLPRAAAIPDTELSQLGVHPVDQIDGQLKTALQSLSSSDVQLVSLVALEGFSVVDAAKVLGISPAAAKSRMHRSRLRLRASLGESFDIAYSNVKEEEQ